MACWNLQVVVICLVLSARLNAALDTKQNRALQGYAKGVKMTLLTGLGKIQIVQVNIPGLFGVQHKTPTRFIKQNNNFNKYLPVLSLFELR